MQNAASGILQALHFLPTTAGSLCRTPQNRGRLFYAGFSGSQREKTKKRLSANAVQLRLDGIFHIGACKR
jgi:hypothetical protein